MIVQQNAGALRRAAPNAPAQLMQLGEAEPLGMLDDHDAGRRHVDADFDDRGRHQDAEPPLGEFAHDRVLLGAFRPPVDKPDRIAEMLAQMRGAFLGGGQIDLGRGLDQRTHPVDLRALAPGRAPIAVDHLLQALERHARGSAPACGLPASR